MTPFVQRNLTIAEAFGITLLLIWLGYLEDLRAAGYRV
jgi:hypothetical protein